MNFDRVQSGKELHELADYVAVALVGWSIAFGLGGPAWLAIAFVFAITRSWRLKNRGLYRVPSVYLAISSMVLVGLLNHYDEYVSGVALGYDSAENLHVPPNQALEPTSTSVTIPAGAGFAPAVAVAHLKR